MYGKDMREYLFKLVWRRWLRNVLLVKVTGWRTCIFETKARQRMRGTMCFFPRDRGHKTG